MYFVLLVRAFQLKIARVMGEDRSCHGRSYSRGGDRHGLDPQLPLAEWGPSHLTMVARASTVRVIYLT